MRQFLIHNNLVVSTKEERSSMDDCTSDSSMKSSSNNSSDEENADTESNSTDGKNVGTVRDYEICTMANDKMDIVKMCPEMQ